MKKLGTFLLIAGIVGLVSCGPSQQDKKDAEKAAQGMVDSMMKKVDTAKAAAPAATPAKTDSAAAKTDSSAAKADTTKKAM